MAHYGTQRSAKIITYKTAKRVARTGGLFLCLEIDMRNARRKGGEGIRAKTGGVPSFKKCGDEKNALKEQGFYHWPAWRRLRLLALQRDHYLCQACLRQKKITPATEVHHMQPIAEHPELALCLDNLESLCWDCHEQTKPRGATETPLGVRIIKP